MKQQKTVLTVIFGVVALFIAGLCKVQGVFGSFSLLFTTSNMVGPVLGMVAGPWSIVALLLFKRLISWSFFGGLLFSPFATYLPTLSAALYWNTPTKAIRLFLPLICMLSFLLHPVGGNAAVYALYWLIPVALYFVNNKSLFVDALAATFIQHAVGSVLWLYMVPTTPALWYSLLPVVVVERLLFATGLIMVVYTAQLFSKYIVPSIVRLLVHPSFFGQSTYTSR